MAESQSDKLLKNVLDSDAAGSLDKYFDCQALAAAGSAITDAGAIAGTFPLFVTVSAADDTKGVILPFPKRPGALVAIKSTVSNKILKVYPHASTIQINAVTAGAAMSLASGPTPTFLLWDGTTWYTIPLLPS